MKFVCKTIINLPIIKVVELFMDKSSYKYWKKDFTGYEPISGISEEAGSVTKLVFKRVTMLETITSKNLPAELRCEYEHKQGKKTVMFHNASNRFNALTGNKTLYELDSVTTKAIGLLPKIMMLLMGKVAKKYAQIQLDQFKIFAEHK